MLKVMPLCRYLILIIAILAGGVVSSLLGNRLLSVVLAVGIIWLNFYLSGLRIYISRNCIVKISGKIFKHKTVILLKNILYFETLTLTPWRPAFVRMRSRGRDVVIIGLNGRQTELLAKVVAIE